jgi:iron complex outermembrane recepter protein
VGRGTMEVTVFNQRLTDQQVNVSFVRPAPQTGQFAALVNAASVKQRGIESGASLTISEAVTLAGTYTYSDFNFDRYVAGTNNFSGKRLPGVPRHTAFTELRYRDSRGLSSSVEAQWVGEFFVNDANTAINPAYTLVNFRIGHDITAARMSLSPFVSVNNLFSESYSSQPQINAAAGRFFNPLPGRNYAAGVKVKW